jgi:uncharacterized protein YkwD
LSILFSSVLSPWAPALAQAPPPNQEAALRAEVEQLVLSLAQAQAKAQEKTAAKGRGAWIPQPDERLSLAATSLARLCAADDTPPAGGIVTEALHLAGLVEPAPHLVAASFTPGGQAALLGELRRTLAETLTQGRFRRLGVGITKVQGGEGRTRVLVALLESFVELEPDRSAGPRWEVSGADMKAGAPGVLVRGRILPPYARPQVITTEPGGQALRLPQTGEGERFEARLRCQVRGRYQVEVVGEDRYGSTVLANFPVYCGVPAPRELSAARPAPDQPFRDSAEAEQQIFALLNADRARFGLPPLAWDARLAEIARAHSADMRAGNFLGHVSPTTGDAADRLRKARYEATVVQENLARAYSPREAQRGLMDSPGHRANILSKSVSHVGVGVQIAPAEGKDRGGARELWVTQLFALPAEPFDAAKAPAIALARLQALRQEAGLAPLIVDPALSALAQRAASDLGQGRLREEQIGQPVQQAMRSPAMRFRAVRTVLALTSDLRRMSPSRSILDPAVTHLGLGLAPAPNEAKGPRLAAATYVVLVLATDAHAKR